MNKVEVAGWHIKVSGWQRLSEGFGYRRSGVVRFESSVVWRMDKEPVALETRPKITKASKFITRKVEN
jgi:hypothetical protein